MDFGLTRLQGRKTLQKLYVHAVKCLYNDGIWKGRVYMHEELKVGKAEILRGKGDQA